VLAAGQHSAQRAAQVKAHAAHEFPLSRRGRARGLLRPFPFAEQDPHRRDRDARVFGEPSETRYEPPEAYGPFTPGDPANFLAIDGAVNLWKGDIAADWDERHIAAKHGWEDQDRSDTASTLVGPSFVERERLGENVLEGSLYIREMPPRNGVPCLRVVVVDCGQWPGEPAARGIITSFGAPQ
jgi:hypothetical protein